MPTDHENRFQLRNLLSSIGKSTLVFGSANVSAAAIPFFILPILTRYLSPTELGIVAMFQAMLSVVTPLVSLGIPGAVHARFYDMTRADFKEYMGTALTLIAIGSVVSLMVVLSCSSIVSSFTGIPSDWMWTLVAAAVGITFMGIRLFIWQGEERPVEYGCFQVLFTALNAFISVILVVVCALGWRGRVLGIVIARVVFGGIGLLSIAREYLSLTFRWDYAVHALRMGLPLIPHLMATWVIGFADRLFITHMVGLGETGIYYTACQIAAVVSIFQVSVVTAWTPWMFRLLNRNDPAAQRSAMRIGYALYGLFLAAALGVSLIAPWLLSFFVGEAFQGAARFVPWIAFGYAVNGMYRVINPYFMYSEKTHILALAMGTAAVLNVVLNYVLISLNGTIGAAQATFCAFAASFLLTWFAARGVFRMSARGESQGRNNPRSP